MRLIHKLQYITFFLVSIFYAQFSYASSMRFGFINPSFGGSPFNASYLTGMADKQNQNQKVTTKEDPNSVAAFKKKLEGQLLATTAGKISKLVSDPDNPLDAPKKFMLNDFTVEVIPINPAAGEYQIIIVDSTSTTTIDTF